MRKYIDEPLLFQGRKQKKNYFEGWYFKQVSKDLESSISVIPGITIGNQNSHAFVQTIINTQSISGPKHETHYYQFPIENFIYQDNPFVLKIGDNVFSEAGIELHLFDEPFSLHGKIAFTTFAKINTSIISPNIMGPFAYLPFMECYHGVISMVHSTSGSLVYNQKTIDFDNGKGYIEKDWGHSFPKEYIWLQSNHFAVSGTSIMCSVANIPFWHTSFQGFICNLTVKGEEYRFATYNRSRLVDMKTSEHQIDILIEKGALALKLQANIFGGGALKAPKNGNMSNVIKEGLDGILKVTLTKKSGEVLFDGEGSACGIELVRI